MHVRTKMYVGRLCRGCPLVYVIRVDGDSCYLKRRARYNVLHSWGFRGVGSLQLAYDMLYDATGDKRLAHDLHRAFQQNYIMPLAHQQSWKMSEHAVLNAAVLLAATGEPK